MVLTWEATVIVAADVGADTNSNYKVTPDRGDLITFWVTQDNLTIILGLQ